MSIYSKVYFGICEARKINEPLWIKGSGIHQHHIIPKHTGGTDDSHNLTYLTVREHIIAHFLLWKIHRNPNDLRSMKMLGVRLSPMQRRETGIFCRDNNIGIFGASKEERLEWTMRAMEIQKNIPNSFYYWSTPEGQKRRAVMGGKIGGTRTKELKLGIHDPEVQKLACSLGGKATKGMICVTNGKHRTRIKPENLPSYLDKGYRLGFTICET